MWPLRRSSPWFEVGSWVGTVGGMRYWMPLSRETRRRDTPLRWRTKRAAELAVRNQQGRVFTCYDVQEMHEHSPRVVCQHTRVDAENCPAYEHTTEAIVAELDDDPGF